MKTRKLKQRRRNQSRHRLRGGARPYLPINNTHRPENWQILYCSSHGSLSPNVYKVPPRTYILHVAPAGKACAKVAWFFDNWIYQYEKPQPATTRSIKHKLFDSLRSRRFLQTANENMRQYLGALNITNKANLTNLSLNFYEPDDIVSDLILTMYNHNLPLFLQGVYEIPIPYELKQAQFDINKKTGAYAPGAEINALNAGIIRIPEATEEQLAEYHTIYNHPANVLRGEMFTANRKEFTLHEILQRLGEVPDGRFRLLIVDACRVGETEPVATRARRLSIAARRKLIRPENATPRSWLSVEWLSRIYVAYSHWISTHGIVGFRAVAFNNNRRELNTIIADLNAGRTVNRTTVFNVLEFIYRNTDRIINAQLAEVLGFTPRAGAGAAAAGAAPVVDATVATPPVVETPPNVAASPAAGGPGPGSA